MKKSLLLLIVSVFFGLSSFAQQITGNVTGKEDGVAIPGVNIMEKGTTNGTITDLDGNFVLNVKDANATLVFKFIGYKTQEIALNGKTNVSVQLEQADIAVDEVVVVGYGVKKKALVTGAISSVGADEINKDDYIATQALQGRSAGVTVIPTSGSPGAGIKIRVRGTSSNGNSDPLYIVDGTRTGDISFLNPTDIESIQVLKDAASAAIYGAEGANGVVLITTKSGKKGQTHASYSFQYGVQSAQKMPKMMNPFEWATYIKEAGTAGTIPNPDSLKNVKQTDWLAEIMSNAPTQNHQVSFSGGSDKSTFMISGSYYTQNGIVGGDKAKYDRYTTRFNGTHDIFKWLQVGNNISFSHFNRTNIDENNEFGGVISNAIMMDPSMPVYYDNTPQKINDLIDQGYFPLQNENGKYYGVSDYVIGEMVNPVAQINSFKGGTVQDKILGNIYANLKPIDGLVITSRLSLDLANQKWNSWAVKNYFNQNRHNETNSVQQSYDKWNTWQWENFASYNKSFGKNDITLLLGTSAQKYQHNYIYATASPMIKPGDNFAEFDATTSDDNDRVSGTTNRSTLLSYFGRVSYNYDSKYILEAVLRRDGSSLFAPGHSWGSFPSISGGWVISNESFFSAVPAVSFLKLRAGWGQNGSLSNLGPDQWRALITSNGIRYPVAGGGYLPGAEPSNLANPELTWETSEQTSLGFDLRFFKDKLGLSVDYYNKITKDLLTPASPPLSIGNAAPFTNGGEVTNKGIELELSYKGNFGDLKYDLSANFSKLSNKVTNLDSLVTRIGGANLGVGYTATYFEKDYPIWYFRGYKTDGIFQNQAEIDKYIADNGLTDYNPVPGDPIVVNVNGDKLINEDDMTMIGNPHPDYTYGAALNLTYKGIDFNLALQGSIGNDVMMGFRRTDNPTTNKPEFFYTDRWTGDGSTNAWPRASATDPFFYRSDLMVENASFMRIKQIEIGYTLPKELTEKARIQSLRIFTSLNNYFTFTKYRGVDPEAGSGANNSLGIDRGVYPIPRTFLAGISISL